jgi:hypothetical protein
MRFRMLVGTASALVALGAVPAAVSAHLAPVQPGGGLRAVRQRAPANEATAFFRPSACNSTGRSWIWYLRSQALSS